MRLVKPYQVSSQTGPPKAAFGTMPFVLALFSHHWLPPFGFTGHNSPATPHSPLPPTTLPRWLLPDADRRFVKDRTGPDLHELPLYIQYVTEPGDSCGKITPFLVTRCRPTVEHSLAAGDAQRQWLQALPDGHQPQCLFSPRFPRVRPIS